MPPDEVAASPTVAESEDASEREKVTLCHAPDGYPGNGRTISVAGDAPQAHLAHGNVLGPCDEDNLPPTRQELQIEAFGERNSDHRRCADYEGAEASTGSVEDGDRGEE